MRVKISAMPVRLFGMAIFATAALSLFGGGTAKAAELSATPETIASVIANATVGDTIKLEAAGADGTTYSYGGFTVDKSLTIDGNNATVAGSTVTVNAQNVTIENLNFVGTENVSFSAVELGQTASGLVLQDNTFSNYMQSIHSGGAEISHSKIVSNTFTNSLQSDIFIMVSGSGVLVRDNNFSNGAQIRGIDSDNIVENVQYAGNTWRMINGQWGVTGVVGLFVDGLTVRNNDFALADGASAGGSAVALINNVANATITGNDISGVSNGIVSYNSGNGDDINSNVVINGNTIDGVAKYAIALQGYTSDVVISNNYLANAELGIAIDHNDVRNSNIAIGEGNTFNNLVGGIYAKPDAIPDNQKIIIADNNEFTSNAFDVYDEEDGAQIDDQRTTEVEPSDPGEGDGTADADDNKGEGNEGVDTDTSEVTEPVNTDDGGVVSAPNTGTIADTTADATDGTSILAAITTALAMLIVLAGIRIATKE